MNIQPKILPVHLSRKAYVYVRQSTLHQVLYNGESTERQYALAERACQLGWEPDQIITIDEDQGQSAASSCNRAGFQQLISAISLEQVGIILVLEVSRLARSCGDWYRVLELAALAGTLIGDEAGIYDPRDYNDRLLLGLKGTLSEAELYTLKTRLQGGRLNKARKGDLAQMLPVGLVRTLDHRVQFDPHSDVQATLRLILDQFDQLGSANAVLRYFRDQNLLVPRLITHGEELGQIVWRRASYPAIHLVLTNPAYAGAFAFGRRKQTAKRVVGEVTKRIRQPMEEWEVLVPDVYPAYITWEHYLANRAHLWRNLGRFAGPSGVPRQGEALLQGIVFCARCGRRMVVRYNDGAYYLCDHLMHRYGDQAVVSAFLEIIEPAHIEATLAALGQLEQQRQASDRLWQQRIERAKYEAERIHRQYSRVEPENRLVVRELEVQWNAALQAIEELQHAYTQAQVQQLTPLSPTDRKQIEQLVQDIPLVWAASTTLPADRKRMLRCLIRDISLDSFSQPGQTRILIRWQTDTLTSLTIHRPTAADGHRLPASTVELIRNLAQQHPDDRIAEILNQKRLKTQQGLDWSYRRVMDTRRRHQIPSSCPIVPYNKQPRGDGLISAQAAAQYLHTCPNTILLWARKGILYNEHKAGLNPVWVRVTPEDIARLNQPVAPENSLSIRQASKKLQISPTHFWEQVQLGRYTVYRVHKGKQYEFRVNLS